MENTNQPFQQPIQQLPQTDSHSRLPYGFYLYSVFDLSFSFSK